jgi:hypothetical protein
MNLVPRLLLSLVAALSIPLFAAAEELVHLGRDGVVRWSDGREVALFGANYSLPSASDYRAAGYAGADRKKLVEQDLTHFARMGWDGLRLALWGDWENCDREGNLIANDHLDLFDYVIAQAKQRGIYMLLTPIHRHSSMWPENSDESAQGFSRHYPVQELGRNPQAIAAQQNFIRQLLDHVNPYTGTAIKNEPTILFIELINEPEHHSSDAAGSIKYINALVEAVRSTGCQKLLFHNLTQDMRMAPIIAASQAQGFTLGWYPTGLVSRRTLEENYLRHVDDYLPLARPEIPQMPRIVYEFDSADMLAAYMYPAMVREFRAIGAQFAAMFGYDMLATAPRNIGWQTHYLNLVYSPRKALSAVIAAEAMRALPRGVNYGSYPHNRKFGPVRVSYEEDLSEFVSETVYLNAGDTSTPAPAADQLVRIAGVGSSPLVSYEGTGCYFVDRIAPGIWRLEVYPDAYFVHDPFPLRYNSNKVAARAVWNEWPMTLRLPDLGTDFSIRPLNAGNSHAAAASNGSFRVRPGVYLVARRGVDVVSPLPNQLGRIGMAEFVCPQSSEEPWQVISHAAETHDMRAPLPLEFDLVGTYPTGAHSASAEAHIEILAGTEQKPATRIPLRRTRGARWSATVPAGTLPPSDIKLRVVRAGAEISWARGPQTIRHVSATDPLALFDAAQDSPPMALMRVAGDRRGGFVEKIAATDDSPAAIRVEAPSSAAPFPTLHALDVPVKRLISDRSHASSDPRWLELHVRGTTGASVRVSLIEADGTAWGTTVTISGDRAPLQIPLDELIITPAVKLPLGYPGNWNYALTAPAGRGSKGDSLQWRRVEHIQFSVTPAQPDIRSTVELSRASLRW